MRGESMTNDEIQALVKQTLNEMDEKPIAVTLRRVVRVANLLGETKTALRFSLELRPFRGSKIANMNDMKGFMADPDLWQSGAGPHEDALREFMEDRQREDEMVQAHTVMEIEYLSSLMEKANMQNTTGEYLKQQQFQRALIETVRMRAFSTLCRWERQLAFTNTNEQIFLRFKSDIDALLAKNAPDIINSFNTVYRRLRDAELTDSQAKEELSQAVTSCRRILKAVADRVFPPTNALSDQGNVLDDQKYRNRIKEFTKIATTSSSMRNSISVSVDGIYDRFTSLDTYTNKGVHADMATEEAETCAINTYIIAGEILRLNR
jgi:hypothetical protein